MCEPISLSTAITLASTAASLGAAGVGYMQAQDLQGKQNAANEQWIAFQKRIRADEDARQESMRQKADAARMQTLDTQGADVQQQTQTKEASRLEADMAQGTSQEKSVNDLLLSGQRSGGANFQADVGQRISQASQAARKRMAALANIQSYGNSFGGLGTENALNFARGDELIGLQNNMRNGSLRTFGVEQSVEPVRYTAGGNLAGSLATSLGSIAGAGWGRYASMPGAAPAAPGAPMQLPGAV